MTLCQAESQTPFDHEPPRLPPPDPDPIRIYVACLAAYNNGHLHGEWIEVTDEASIWEEIRLKKSLQVLADAIACHGDKYWPLYEIVDDELSRIKRARKKIAKTRKELNKYG